MVPPKAQSHNPKVFEFPPWAIRSRQLSISPHDPRLRRSSFVAALVHFHPFHVSPRSYPTPYLHIPLWHMDHASTPTQLICHDSDLFHSSGKLILYPVEVCNGRTPRFSICLRLASRWSCCSLVISHSMGLCFGLLCIWEYMLVFQGIREDFFYHGTWHGGVMPRRSMGHAAYTALQ